MILLLSFREITIAVLHYVLTNSKQAEEWKDIQIKTYMNSLLNIFKGLPSLTACLLLKTIAKTQQGKERVSLQTQPW